jgi:hypothetical protein
MLEKQFLSVLSAGERKALDVLLTKLSAAPAAMTTDFD